jgi:transcriptional regulator with XRE-family HTH domain
VSEEKGPFKPVDVIDMFVGERVREYRKEFSLTQSQLAERLGVTFQQVQKYEKETNRISAGRLFQIAEILKVPIQELYPQADEVAAAQAVRDDAGQRVSTFALSADGWRLCQAFLRITDADLRRSIIALVQALADPSRPADAQDNTGASSAD